MMYIDAIEIVTGRNLILIATRTKLHEIIAQDIIFFNSQSRVETMKKRVPFTPLLATNLMIMAEPLTTANVSIYSIQSYAFPQNFATQRRRQIMRMGQAIESILSQPYEGRHSSAPRNQKFTLKIYYFINISSKQLLVVYLQYSRVLDVSNVSIEGGYCYPNIFEHYSPI